MWPIVAAIVVAFVASFLLMPKPQSQPPAGLDEIEAPTAEVGREIPVLFGRRRIKSPNVVWYGHLRTVAIKAKGGKK